MRKLTIIEIENSYLNFFTPAIIIVAGFFLYSLIAWSLSILPWFFYVSKIEVDTRLLSYIMGNIAAFSVVLVAYYVFIPKLKVQDADYKEFAASSLIDVFLLFCLAILFRQLLTAVFSVSGTKIYDALPWFVNSYNELSNPAFMLLFLLYRLVIKVTYAELVFRRVVIPSMEDRGLSPFNAVLLASLGFCLLDIPLYFELLPYYLSNLYWLGSTFIYGFFTGCIYILTRNLIFPICYGIIYHIYRLTGELGSTFQNEFLLTVRTLLDVITFAVGLSLAVYVIWKLLERESTAEWVSVLKKRSSPHIRRGLIGFLLITFGLIGLQILVTVVIKTLTSEIHPNYFILMSVFYFVAFSIPFWLTVTTEYAQD